MTKTIKYIIAAIGTCASILVCGSAAQLGGVENQKTSSHTIQTPSAQTTETQSQAKSQPKVEQKRESYETTIPYETSYIEAPNLEQGQTRVVTDGIAGIETTIDEVTYTDGVETHRENVAIEVTRQPVNRVVARSTYVAPKYVPVQSACENGTYINSAGNTVRRPSATNTGGATVVCRDGSYSYSQSRRGTCSHHGGVLRWL